MAQISQKRTLGQRIRSFPLFATRRRLIITAIIVIVIGVFAGRTLLAGQQAPQYQTAKVARGTLVSTVSESGQVVGSNRVAITTQASGVINHVYVKDGDYVTAGETIADMTLDTAGAQHQAAAWSTYEATQSTLAAAQAKLYSLQSTMYNDWNTFTNLAQNSTYTNGDGSPNLSNRALPEFTTTQDNWLGAEADYKNQQQVISQAQSAQSNAWLAYQTTSPTITAPQSGVITDVVITPGLQITSSTNAATNTISSQPVASIKTQGNPIVSVSLSEVDVTKVKTGDSATVTFDALPNQTFTGKIMGIDTTGVVSSGVTTYPATIVLDTPNDQILPNMSATANIITGVKNNALLVPTAAVQTTGNQSTVRVLSNGKVQVVPVTIGASSDTDTEITSGLTEGQTVIIGFIPTGGQSQTSPFNRGLFNGGGGGGGRVLFRGGGG